MDLRELSQLVQQQVAPVLISPNWQIRTRFQLNLDKMTELQSTTKHK